MNVKRYRQARGWTQQQLADRIGCTQPFIALIERGTYVPSLAMLARIAKALKTTLSALVK